MKTFIVIGLIIIGVAAALLYRISVQQDAVIIALVAEHKQHQKWRERSDALLEKLGVRHEVNDGTIGIFWMVPILENYQMRIEKLETEKEGR